MIFDASLGSFINILMLNFVNSQTCFGFIFCYDFYPTTNLVLDGEEADLMEPLFLISELRFKYWFRRKMFGCT